MADPYSILGLISPAEQAVRLIKSLIERHKAYQENKTLSAEMLTAYTTLRTQIMELKDMPIHGTSSQHMGLLQHEIEDISSFILKSLEELQTELDNPKVRLGAYASAVGDRGVLEKRKQEAGRLHDRILKASAGIDIRATRAAVESTRPGTGDMFRASIRAEHNSASIYVKLDSRGSDGLPNTCESRLKAAVLRRDRNMQVGATAVGQGGVGKTCALRAIAHDVEIKAEFSGGVYFMSLGKDGNVGRLIEELCVIVEASGGNQTAAEMRGQSEFGRVLTKVHAWFGSHVCLFIIDDVWVVNDIDANILQKLSVLADTAGGSGERRSRLLYSTRDRELRQIGERVAFEPRETEGKEAVDMLVHASEANRDEVDDARCKEAVGEILEMCGGLPLALNVAGTSVRYMRERWEGEVSEAWGAYLSRMKSRNTIRGESPKDGYSSLDGTLHTSLDILESDIGNGGETVDDFSFRKMHRSLCVMKKQDRIPLSLVRDLWEMDDERTEWCAKEMERVGLVELQYEKGCGGLRVHDLTHDFAVQEAKKKEGVEEWCKKMADVCRAGGGLLEMSEGRDGEGKSARGEYVFENIYRVLRQGGCVEELKRLFLSARWVKTVIQRGGVWQYEEAVKGLSRELKRKRGSGKVGMGPVDEDAVDAMVLMMRAARLSVPFCGESSAGIYFQLYGRVKHKARDSSCVQKMLEEIERYAPRPWVRPVNECVSRAGGRLVDHIVLPYYGAHEIQVGIDSSGEMYGCQVDKSGAEVTVFTQSAEKETKMVRLEGEFETESQDAGDLEASGHKRGARLRACFRMCIGSVTSEVTDVTGKKWSVTKTTCATFCERKGYAVVGYDDGTLRLWIGHTHGVHSVAMSGDGRRVVSGSADKSVRVWDVETGAQIGDALVGHTYAVVSVAISEDGRRVVSGSEDKSVRVWDVERGITLHTGREEDWEEIASQFLRTADLGTGSRTGRTSEIFSRAGLFSREGGIVQRRKDGSEAVLAQLDDPVDLQIDQDHGVAVGGSSRLVAIMKLVV
ncbi:WD40-repeat containing protein [Chondrus crispus]|uniref:WD40-repeat containing protein n=1 Tax=Chondrus crispus TaxID=2769 RepID=R7Q6P4_CHOCR|nr:WD40-repeat containing protein [Chondrus crispus]CDF34217.1 WD40-repeat containing protein [Chondrus crispus]|eukprot:XP_005714036.1 WD40-repeat containing protein [Chondrus crispus]